MPTYTPPLRDMQFVMHEVLNVVDELKMLPAHADIDADTINAVLEEGGKFAAEVIAPLNQSGDAEGCTLDKATHEVKAPKGFKEAYAKYVEGGWPALSCDTAYGGQGLPHVVNQSFYEMLNSSNQAWTMYPGLSHGAYEALHAHGSAEQKALYLPKLKRVRKVARSDRGKSFMDTDFSYADIASNGSNEGSLKRLANAQVEGRDCYVLTGTGDEASIYGAVTMFIDVQTFVPMKIEYADKAGKPLKVYTTQKLKAFKDRTLAAESLMTNLQTGSKTQMTILKLEESALGDDAFTERALERG